MIEIFSGLSWSVRLKVLVSAESAQCTAVDAPQKIYASPYVACKRLRITTDNLLLAKNELRPMRNFLSLSAAREVLECRRRRKRRRGGRGWKGEKRRREGLLDIASGTCTICSHLIEAILIYHHLVIMR